MPSRATVPPLPRCDMSWRVLKQLITRRHSCPVLGVRGRCRGRALTNFNYMLVVRSLWCVFMWHSDTLIRRHVSDKLEIMICVSSYFLHNTTNPTRGTSYTTNKRLGTLFEKWNLSYLYRRLTRQIYREIVSDWVDIERSRRTYIDQIGNVLKEIQIKSTRSRWAWAVYWWMWIKLERFAEGRSRWRSVVFTYSVGTKAWEYILLNLSFSFNSVQ